MRHQSRLSSANKSSRLAIVTLIACLSLAGFELPSARAADTKKDRQKELDEIKTRIEDVKSNLDDARSQSELLQEDLRRAEIAAGTEQLRLKGLEQQIEKQYNRLSELNQVISYNQEIISKEREQLANQIRAAYIAGRSDYLKLLLNQEDPANVGRVIAYYDYYNRARTRSINSIQEKIDLINELRLNIESETLALEQLKERQIARRTELVAFRQSRSQILEQLKADISEKGDELKSLEENKQKLSALLEKLDKEKQDPGYFDDLPPFGNLKGKLSWPVNGKLLNTFGAQRKGNSLRWQGVRISSDAGDDVKAIHTGKVIYADWFRNLGLLVILDHGGGFMSLYGYNQSLLKKPGDLVLAGETIAYAGDSGGQLSPAVYFEIRHNGKPVNPGLWCRR